MNANRRTFVSGTAATLLSGAWTSSLAQSPNWAGSAADTEALNKLYDAAVSAGEKEVVIYGAYFGIFRPIWDQFQARFPKISIIGSPLSGAQLATKLDAEYSSGQHSADIVTSGFTELMGTVSANRGLPYVPPNIANIPRRYHDAQGRFVVNYAEIFGVVYNTDKLKAAELPRTPADLLAPKYKGLIIDEPNSARATDLVWNELYNSGKIDGAWIRAMKAQANSVPSWVPMLNQLTTGTITMIPWVGHARFLGLKQAGAPVGFQALPGMATPSYAGTVILSKAPHPAAARLFQAWFITPEAQNAIITKGNSYALAPAVALPDNKADWPALAPIAEALKPLSGEEYMAALGNLRKAVDANFK